MFCTAQNMLLLVHSDRLWRSQLFQLFHSYNPFVRLVQLWEKTLIFWGLNIKSFVDQFCSRSQRQCHVELVRIFGFVIRPVSIALYLKIYPKVININKHKWTSIKRIFKIQYEFYRNRIVKHCRLWEKVLYANVLCKSLSRIEC